MDSLLLEPADLEITGDPMLPPKDRPFLLAAITAHADCLLTGDLAHFGQLMGMAFHGVTVMLPGDYLRGRR